MPLLPDRTVQRIADRTPPDRDRYADLLRLAAILIVMVGHWGVAVILVEDGRIVETTELIALVPETRPLTWIFQVLPLFFLVGGAVNAGSWARARRRGEGWPTWIRRRSRRLLHPLLPLLAVWVPSAIALDVIGVPGRYVGLAARTAFIPVWFLVVYVGVVGLVPVTTWLHRRFGIGVLVTVVLLTGIVDVLHRSQVPAVGFANYVLVWGACHQLGYLWADGRLPERRSRALALAVAGALAMAGLISLPAYSIAMVQATGVDGNTAPPSLALLAFALAQLGVVLALRGPAERWLQRPGVWAVVAVGGTLIMTAFLWHMTALVIAVVATHPTGLWPATAAVDLRWWALRPLWLLLCAAILAGLIVVFRRFEQTSDPAPGVGGVRTVVGLGATVTGLAVVMVEGIIRTERPLGVPLWPLGLFLAGAVTLGAIGRGAADGESEGP